jgi:hypothetical protein
MHFFKSHNWLAYESFKSRTFNAWKLPWCLKTDREVDLPDATSMKVSSQNTNEG